MPLPLSELEQQRSLLATQLARLGDLRPGSVTGIVRRCGKPNCHCAQPDDPGHGPTLRLTYKVQGKTSVKRCRHQLRCVRQNEKSQSSGSFNS